MESEKDRTNRMHFVYAIRVGKYVKIGVTTNIYNRLSWFRSANPHKIALVEITSYPRRKEAVQEEQRLLQKYRKNKRHGEWIKLDKDKTINIRGEKVEFKEKNYHWHYREEYVRPPHLVAPGRKPQPYNGSKTVLRRLWKEARSVRGVATKLGYGWQRTERYLHEAGIIDKNKIKRRPKRETARQQTQPRQHGDPTMARKAAKAKAKSKPKAVRGGPKPKVVKVSRKELRAAWKERPTVNGVAKALDIPWKRAKEELEAAKLV